LIDSIIHSFLRLVNCTHVCEREGNEIAAENAYTTTVIELNNS